MIGSFFSVAIVAINDLKEFLSSGDFLALAGGFTRPSDTFVQYFLNIFCKELCTYATLKLNTSGARFLNCLQVSQAKKKYKQIPYFNF